MSTASARLSTHLNGSPGIRPVTRLAAQAPAPSTALLQERIWERDGRRPRQRDPLDIAADLADGLSDRLADGRPDGAGGHAIRECDWVRAIRASGLLTLSIPARFGGQGASWSTVFQTIRLLARADSALAHVYAFHHLQLAGLILSGSPAQQRRFLALTVDRELFWGNAYHPHDRGTIATEAGDGFLLDGGKSYTSGAAGSDWLTVSAWHEATQSTLIGIVPTSEAGVQVRAEADAHGQHRGGGGISFTHVPLPADQVLHIPGHEATPRATLRAQLAQLIMANLYLGIGEGAFEAARQYTLGDARPRSMSGTGVGAGAAAADPLLQHRYGQLWLRLRPAAVLVDHAAQELDRLLAKGALVTARERGEVAVAVAEAKCLAHAAGIEISGQMFELTGARSTAAQYGLDRYWRNVRAQTLHDPVDYKVRDLGRYALEGTVPEPTAYA